jgi:steroid 5-alpha reductase family enzyme
MLVTILLLIFTVVVLPIVSFYFGTPLSTLQHNILVDHMVYVVGAVVAYCFLVGEISRNNSQVDKLWSVVPIYYVWHMAAVAGFPDRMVLMAVLVSIWGIRLTGNFARRGAYTLKF